MPMNHTQHLQSDLGVLKNKYHILISSKMHREKYLRLQSRVMKSFCSDVAVAA